MRQASHIRNIWTSVRPRTRRGAVLAAVAIVGASAFMAAALLSVARVAWSPYLDYGANPDSNARQWAALDMRFADSDGCAACHEAEATALHAAPHQGVGCQSCHGALLGHATAEASARPKTSAVTAVMAAAIAMPTDAMCIRCHLEVAGRPGTLKQITASQHYVAQCLACHNPHSSVAIRPPVVPHPLANLPACLICHGPDGFKARSLRHPSGALTDAECLSCHDAGSDTGSFAHKGFPLTGKHLGAACSACHTDMSSLAAFQATPKDCVACHQNVEPHKGSLGTSCGDCHNPSSWADATIDHNVTGFKLVGHHADAACASCHKNGVWAGTPTACASCHERPANHESSFGNVCSSCHTPKGWKPATFDHNARTPYKLTGAHVGAACVKCHTNPNTHAGAPTVCAGCHTKPAGHIPVASTVCQTCHSTKAWQPATFNHSSAFKLTGVHATLNCASCHKGGVYSGLPTTCAGCHNRAGIHSPLYPATCTACHSTSGWMPISYKGPHTFPMNHNGAAGRCTTCHASSTVGYTCAKCHSDSWAKSKHSGVSGFSVTTCARCHPRGNGGG
jgi:hypothetical protein